MKTRLLSIALIWGLLSWNLPAQTIKKMTAENGGSGPYKAEIVSDSTLANFTIFRPVGLQDAVSKEGRLPIILYANGACANSSVEIRHFLNELASWGYLAIAIGPYDEEDFYDHWRKVMTQMYPRNGKRVIMGNGEEVMKPERPATPTRRPSGEARPQRRGSPRSQARPHGQSNKGNYPRMLLEALDWLTDQTVDKSSEYYHIADLQKVAVMGQSCGGTQALAVSHDPRVKTSVILNSGMGDMGMQGMTKERLQDLHAPTFYLIGGENDIAFGNALKDFRLISHIPVVMVNTQDEHEGTYYEKNGGAYAVAVKSWLDWQLKGNIESSSLFLDDSVIAREFPTWSIVRKNF